MTKKNNIILFDLDKTLITCDSLKLLVLFLFFRNFSKFFIKIPSLIIIIIRHFISNSDHKTETKSRFFSIILKNYNIKEIQNFSNEFATYIFSNFKNKKIYNKLINAKKLGTEIYIVTASADFYCKFIAKLFDTKLISTKIHLNKKNLGKIIGKNCYGIEKKHRVLKEIKEFKKKYSIFYTDSKSDRYLMKICSKSYFVK
jgi:phosphatidylglycerophosphatase C